MISTREKSKVMDFGVARAATPNTINSDVMGLSIILPRSRQETVLWMAEVTSIP